jgi:autotransporter strand-loop-strand O-heptosyltransferase
MFKNKKVLIITPHLSTGGCPQYLLEFLNEYIKDFKDFLVVEHSNFSDQYVIQKNKIIDLIGVDKLLTLGNYGEPEPIYTKKRTLLIDVLNSFEPDIVWMNEFPEAYDYQLPPDVVMNHLYKKERNYKIIETTHFNAFDFRNKRFIPDEFMFCSEIHLKRSQNIDIPKFIWEVPLNKKERPNRDKTLISLGLNPNKLHILNVGLFHENKNQKYIFDLAKKFKNKNIQFHFIGNTCFLNECEIGDDVFLTNCKIWGERSDVDLFMSCMDIYLFPSKKELNPLTVKEALSWGMDVVVNRDDNYVHQYTKFENFFILDEIDIENFINTRNKFGTFLIVCSFYNNDKKHIEQTFQNVLNQTYKNWKLIVGDDFSEDPEFRQFLKNKVLEINDSRILYYNINFKRELYLYQNLFSCIDYDYYFDLDSDDLINPKILEIYQYYFNKHPEVMSIFSGFKETNEDLKVQKYGIILPVENYIEEFEYRNNSDVNELWSKKSSYSMFGVGRCMRRPTDDKFEIIDNCRTSTDTLFLFYNLCRGKHLHLPRNLYTYVKRENSDSSKMSFEEHKKFNMNASKYIEKYKKIESTNNKCIFHNVWYETSALSTCEFIVDVDNITLISNLSDKDQELINELYFDKKVSYNKPDGENLIIVLNKIPKNFEWDKIRTKNITIYYYNDNYDYSVTEMFDKFNETNKNIVDDISKKIFGFTWFNFFRHLVITKKEMINKNKIIVTYRDGIKVDIVGDDQRNYVTKFINDDDGTLIWETNQTTNTWVSPNIKYYVNWRVEIYLGNIKVYSENLNLKNKKVLISFDSRSLGDSVAWIPYVEEFRKKHNCNVICSTFHNDILVKAYPDIMFAKPNTQIENIYAQYYIGASNEENPYYTPIKVNEHPLQAVAASILGLKPMEIRPDLTQQISHIPSRIEGEYVTLSEFGSAENKHWKGDWQKVVNYFIEKGIEVVVVSKEKTSLTGVTDKSGDFPLEERMVDLKHAKMHLGVSSGLSWLAWSLGTHVVMISDVTPSWHEFNTDITRLNANKLYAVNYLAEAQTTIDEVLKKLEELVV